MNRLAKFIIDIYPNMCSKKRREKNARDEKVLLRNRATIAQVITKLNVWLLNRMLELEKATYAIFCFIQLE